jgi:hypothetical protein
VACDVIWFNGKLCGTAGDFKTMAPWTWRHTGARMEIMPEGSVEIKHVDEETISYHTLFTFDVIV